MSKQESHSLLKILGFFENLKEGVQKVAHFLLGYYRHHTYNISKNLIRDKVKKVYLSRVDNLKDECKKVEKCPGCGCKMPHMLWVKPCEECEKKNMPINVSNQIIKIEGNVGEKIKFEVKDLTNIKSVKPSCGCTNVKFEDSLITGYVRLNKEGIFSKTLDVYHKDDSRTLVLIKVTVNKKEK